jgi:ATP-binding cassette, subfamily B, bacterial
MRPHARQLTAFGAVLAIATSLPLASALLLTRFVRLAAANAPTTRLVHVALAYAALGLASSVLTVAVTWRATVAAWQITNGLRHDLAGYVLSADLGFHRDRTPGELVTRVDADITSMTEFMSTVVSQLLAIAALAVGAVVLAIVVEPILAPALAVVFAFIGLVTFWMRDHSVAPTVIERAADADVMSAAEQYLAGADDVAALGAGRHGVRRVGERSATMVAAARQRVKAQMTMQGTIRMSVATAEVFMIGCGAVAVNHRRLDVAGVVFGFRLVMTVAGKVDHLTWRMQDAQGASGAARRVLELVGEQRIVASGTATLPTGLLDVTFDNAELIYDDEEGTNAAVHALTLVLPAGRVLGVVGRTGSGKTSIGRLVLRLVPPTSGRITMGGVDLASIEDADLRRRVTAIPQDVQLFPGSVHENVTLFADFPASEVRAALVDVGLASWLDGLANGLDTRLSSDNRDNDGTRVGLSAGQAQLLALSRALLRKPSVVLLDEATSRVDPATQDAIGHAMRCLLAGRTAIVIAHRLETLDICDDIAVLSNGRLVEHGPRATLAADPTTHYARLRAAGTESEELR